MPFILNFYFYTPPRLAVPPHGLSDPPCGLQSHPAISFTLFLSPLLVVYDSLMLFSYIVPSLLPFLALHRLTRPIPMAHQLPSTAPILKDTTIAITSSSYLDRFCLPTTSSFP